MTKTTAKPSKYGCITTPEFIALYNAAYDFMYERRHNTMNGEMYDTFVQLGADFSKAFPDEYRAFCWAIEDCLTSDRELAAFAYALSIMG